MKCPSCRAEWSPPAKSSVIMASCPFCGASLVSDDAGSSMEKALQTVYQQVGEAGMRNGDRLLSYFLDLAVNFAPVAPSARTFSTTFTEF